MNWPSKRERGSEFSLNLMVWLAHASGRSFCRLLLYPITLYFILTDRIARKASADYLTTLLGRKARFYEVFRHLLTFATTLLDRVYFAGGHFSKFKLAIEGIHLLDEALEKGKGCILLGSHLGSFDIVSLARYHIDDHPVKIMMRVDPNSRLRRIAGIDDSLLQIIPQGLPQSLLVAHQTLGDGGIVAFLADRVEKRALLPVSFLGHTTAMPKGPYVLAARSGAPVLSFFGVYEGGNRYRIQFIDPELVLTQSSNLEALQVAAQRYATLLEELTRRYPYNWFNFYPYWHTTHSEK